MSELRFDDGQVFLIERTAPDLVFTSVVPPLFDGPPAHRHRHESETFTVHEGRLLVRVGRQRRGARGRRIGDRAAGHDARLRQPLRRAAAAGSGPPPLLRMAEINAEHDWSFTLAGLPDGPQRVLWKALAALARARR